MSYVTQLGGPALSAFSALSSPCTDCVSTRINDIWNQPHSNIRLSLIFSEAPSVTWIVSNKPSRHWLSSEKRTGTMDLFTEPQLSHTPDVVWTPLSVITLTVLLAAVPGNAIVLYRFLLDPALCSPINVYFINLFSANLLSVLLNIPLTLVNNLRGGWWTGRASCTALLYSRILLAGMFATHLLITVSRLWAVVAPEDYLRRHTRRVAAGVCAVMWLTIHAFKVSPQGYDQSMRIKCFQEKITVCVCDFERHWTPKRSMTHFHQNPKSWPIFHEANKVVGPGDSLKL